MFFLRVGLGLGFGGGGQISSRAGMSGNTSMKQRRLHTAHVRTLSGSQGLPRGCLFGHKCMLWAGRHLCLHNLPSTPCNAQHI